MDIAIRGLTKSFGSKQVLKGLGLELKSGQSLVILGGSGSGKTVLIKIISGLLAADGGSVKIDSNEVVGYNDSQRLKFMEKIGFAFQLNALFDSYKIWKNVCFKLLFSQNSKHNAKELKEIAKQKLLDVGLSEDVADLYPNSLSGGMQKRVAIARAMVGSPEILFFDEPTSGLDPLTGQKISKLIKNCSVDGKSVTKISIMHDIPNAKIIADKIAFIYQGRVEWFGDVSNLENSGNQNLDEFIKSSF